MPRGVPGSAKTKPKRKRAPKSERWKNLDPNKPLTPKETMFAELYLETLDAKNSALKAGVPEGTAHSWGHDMVNYKPNVRKYIQDRLADHYRRLGYTAYDALKRCAQIAFTNFNEVCEWNEDGVTLLSSADISEEGHALIAGVEERVNERGDRTVVIKTKDSLAALEKFMKYQGLFNPARQAPQAPLPEQVEALKAVRDGDKTPIEAALDLEVLGIPLPDTLRVLINRQPPEDTDDDGDMLIPTAQELDERHAKRMAEIEGQRESFLPQRQKEVREMKAEIEAEGKQSFQQPEAEEND